MTSVRAARRSRATPRPPRRRRRVAPARPDPEAPSPGEWLDLYDYGVIGNLSTAVLISRFGSIDWGCFPQFHSPSVFGRILDRSVGGFARVAPPAWESTVQRYVPGTNVLTTHFVVGPRRRLAVTDFMPVTPAFVSAPQTRILRRLEAGGGPVEVEFEIEPRFDYGRGGTTDWSRDGPFRSEWRHGFDELSATAPWRWKRRGERAIARGSVRPGAPVFLSLDWGGRPSLADPAVLLNATVRFWRNWVRHPDAPLLRATHVWRDWVERSELLLKLLSNVESGAFVAAPTTSIPEWPGGVRNWDYRYAWVRDAAFSAQSLMLLGHVGEARHYVQWIVGRLAAAGPEGLRTMYRSTGEAVDPEEVLDHWEGYESSRPVRIGNAAGDQLQLDIYGEVLDAVEQLAPVDPAFVRRNWPVLSHLVESAAASWKQPDAGIWESRAAPAHYVHSKVMCWVALDRGHQIAGRLGLVRIAARWLRVGEQIRKAVLRDGYDREVGAFVAAFDRRHLDASALRIPMTGFLSYDDPRILSTMAVLRRDLADGPFLRRYRSERSLHGPEGTFLLCSFWLVECLARSGNYEDAVRLFRRLLRIAGPLRLFSEEYDVKAGRPLGNYPQAFTHIGVLRAALAVSALPPPLGTRLAARPPGSG